MPTISADRIIGKGLIAKVRVAQYDGAFKKIGTFAPQETIGTVYSFVQRDGKLFWMLYDVNNKPFYVQHGVGRFVITESIRDQIRLQRLQERTERQEAIKEQKGELRYYIEKYGLWVLGTFAFVAITTAYLKNKK